MNILKSNGTVVHQGKQSFCGTAHPQGRFIYGLYGINENGGATDGVTRTDVYTGKVEVVPTTGDSPPATTRYQSSVRVNDDIWMNFGKSDGFLSTWRVFSLLTNVWSTPDISGDPISGRSGVACDVIYHVVWCFGGLYGSGHPYTYFSDLFSLKTVDHTLTKHAPAHLHPLLQKETTCGYSVGMLVAVLHNHNHKMTCIGSIPSITCGKK